MQLSVSRARIRRAIESVTREHTMRSAPRVSKTKMQDPAIFCSFIFFLSFLKSMNMFVFLLTVFVCAKTYLVIKQRRAFEIINIVSNVVLERGHFSLKYLNLRKTSGLKPFSCIWKKSVQQGFFFFHLFLATLISNWAQIFSDLLFNAYVGYTCTKWEYWSLTIYQTCSVPLKRGLTSIPRELGN